MRAARSRPLRPAESARQPMGTCARSRRYQPRTRRSLARGRFSTGELEQTLEVLRIPLRITTRYTQQTIAGVAPFSKGLSDLAATARLDLGDELSRMRHVCRDRAGDGARHTGEQKIQELIQELH